MAIEVFATDNGPEHECGGRIWSYEVHAPCNGTRDVLPTCHTCGKFDRPFQVGAGDQTIADIKRAHAVARGG